MNVALLLGAVVIVLVGLPLGAVAWSHAKHLRRPPLASWMDVLYAEARRSHLSPSQIEQVTVAVNRGSVVPAELRSITVAAASAKVAWLESVLRPRQRQRRLVGILVLLVLAAAVGLTAVLAHQTGVSSFAAVEVLVISFLLRLTWGAQLRHARHAVRLNAAPTGIGLDKDRHPAGLLPQGTEELGDVAGE